MKHGPGGQATFEAAGDKNIIPGKVDSRLDHRPPGPKTALKCLSISLLHPNSSLVLACYKHMHMSSEYTTIRVKPETKAKIATLGSYNDTMDGILNKLVERAGDQ